MRACSYCGRQNDDDLAACSSCGTELVLAGSDNLASRQPEPSPLPPPSALATLGMDFVLAEGFSRPDWRRISCFVQENVPREDWGPAWCWIAERWLQELALDLGGSSRVYRSENFLCLSDLEQDRAQAALTYAESVVGTIRANLKHAAWTGYHGKHVLLLFADHEDYFSYISYFYREGSHALSAGVFIPGGYAHVALPYLNARATEHTLVHELVHNLLCHLPIPGWLNEGLAVLIERHMSRYPFLLDADLVTRHTAHWNEENIQRFWAGTSFDEPGEMNELSYGLAQIFATLLSEKGPGFIEFVRHADWRDGGQDAALNFLNLDLGELAAGFLGPGNWRPRRKAIADVFAKRRQ